LSYCLPVIVKLQKLEIYICLSLKLDLEKGENDLPPPKKIVQLKSGKDVRLDKERGFLHR